MSDSIFDTLLKGLMSNKKQPIDEGNLDEVQEQIEARLREKKIRAQKIEQDEAELARKRIEQLFEIQKKQQRKQVQLKKEKDAQEIIKSHLIELSRKIGKTDWECADQYGNVLNGELGGIVTFRVTKGMMTYKLTILDKDFCKQNKIVGTFSSVNPYDLKKKAEKFVNPILDFRNPERP